jgi:hypothetical protein
MTVMHVSVDGVPLDAKFTLEEYEGRPSVVIESRGGSAHPRNPDYNPALREMLDRLGRLGASIVECFVDSGDVGHLSVAERRVTPGEGFPVQLAGVDAEVLRLELTRLQRPIGRRPGARGPGNRTRRMRMVLSVPAIGDASALAARLQSFDVSASAAAREEAAVEVVIRGRGGTGMLRDAVMRRAIERHAVDIACRYFRAQKWDVADVGDAESYDLRCVRADEELHVEVKGTTTRGDAVILTRNEVQHAREFPHVALFIVTGIELTSDDEGKPGTRGGREHVVSGWSPDEADLSPLTYHYDTSKFTRRSEGS